MFPRREMREKRRPISGRRKENAMYSMDFTATISSCNAEGKLKLCSALQMMQDCSEMWIESEPGVARYFRERHMAQLLVFRQVEVVRVPVCKEKLTVSTSVYGMKPKFGFRNTFIRDAAGKPCYRTWSMGAFVDRAGGTLARVDDATIASMTIEERLEMPYRDRHIAVPSGGGTEFEPFRVMRADIDYNRHMNNANYVRMALELLPDGFDPAGLRVEYRRPAKLGDRLAPVMHLDGKLAVVTLSVNGETSAVMEFSGK